MIKTDVYVHASKDSMHELGEKLGLSGDALRMFSYTCCEVKLTVDVDEGTGESKILAVDGVPLANKQQCVSDDNKSCDYIPFRCPECGGSHFGSVIIKKPDGSLWKVTEECHDEFNVGCRKRIDVVPVMVCKAREKAKQ